MATERVTLPGGDWVDLVTRLNHAQLRRIRQAAASPDQDSLTEGVAAMCSNWSVRDVDGADIPYPGGGPEGVPSEALDRFPADVVVAVARRAAEIAAGGPDPNGSTATSGDLPREPSSA